MFKSSEILPYLEAVNIAPSQFTDWIEEQEVTTAQDLIAPAAPTIALTAGNQLIEVDITPPTLNEDGTNCVDIEEYRIYYKTSSGVTSGDDYVVVKSLNHPLSTDVELYIRVSAIDWNGNESELSTEYNETPTEETFTPTIGNQSNIANVYEGDGVIGIVFLSPYSGWSGDTHWELQRADDGGSGTFPGSPSWSTIYEGNGPGFIDKTVDPDYLYGYRARRVGGTVSNDWTEDTNSGSGYQANAADNSDLLNNSIVLSQSLVATDEVRGDNIFAGSTIGINSRVYGNQGIQLDYNSGTPRAYIGDGSNQFFAFDGTKILWKAANSELDSSGNLVATSVDLTGAIKATSGYFGTGSTVVAIESGGLNVGASGHVRGGATSYSAGTGFFLGYDTDAYKIRIGSTTEYMRWTGSAFEVAGGSILASTIETADSGARVALAPTYGGYNHSVLFYDSSDALRGILNADNIIIDDSSGNNEISIAVSTNTGNITLADGGTTAQIYLKGGGSDTIYFFFGGVITGTAGNIVDLDYCRLDINTGSSVNGALSTSNIPSLDASKITTGTFSSSRIPSLDASKITSGTFASARIPGQISDTYMTLAATTTSVTINANTAVIIDGKTGVDISTDGGSGDDVDIRGYQIGLGTLSHQSGCKVTFGGDVGFSSATTATGKSGLDLYLRVIIGGTTYGVRLYSW